MHEYLFDRKINLILNLNIKTIIDLLAIYKINPREAEDYTILTTLL